MSENDHSIKADPTDQVEHQAPLLEETQAQKKQFVEPEISVPIDVFKATTFFLFATNDGDTFP